MKRLTVLLLILVLAIETTGVALAEDEPAVEPQIDIEETGPVEEIDDTAYYLSGDEYAEWSETRPRRLPVAMAGAQLDQVRTEIEAFLAETEGRVSVALIQPGSGTVLELNPEERYGLASLAKLYILLAYVEGLEKQDLWLNEDESFLVEAMITISDNYSADLLWEALGGNEGLLAFLDWHELPVPLFSEDADWGAITATPGEVATLLLGLDTGSVASEPGRDLVFDLLSRVAEGQRWGVSAGITGGASVWLKDGWYPDEYGWRVNSGGVVRAEDGTDYVLVILTDGQPSLEYGIETTEAIAALINQSMLPIVTVLTEPTATEALVDGASPEEDQPPPFDGTQGTDPDSDRG